MTRSAVVDEDAGVRPLAVLGMFLVLAATGCSGGSDKGGSEATTAARAPVERYISSAELGEAWPLTVSGGMLRCEGPGAVSFMTDEGIIYALNGTATTWSRTNNLAWKDVELIRADDLAVSGRKIKLAQLISAGLVLCRDS